MISDLEEVAAAKQAVLVRLAHVLPRVLADASVLRETALQLEGELAGNGIKTRAALPDLQQGGAELAALVADAGCPVEHTLAVSKRLHKQATVEVHSRVASARACYNRDCCPIIALLGADHIRRHVFAHLVPNESSSGGGGGGSTAAPMKDLVQCRAVCRQFRSWMDQSVRSAPQLVVCGGAGVGSLSEGGGPQRSCEALDFISLRWTRLPRMRAKRCGAAVCGLHGVGVLVAGGKSSEHVVSRSAELLCTAPKAGSGRSDLHWRPVADMSAPRYGCASLQLLDGRAMVIGGRGNKGYLATVEAFCPNRNRCAIPATVIASHSPGENWATLVTALVRLAAIGLA